MSVNNYHPRYVLLLMLFNRSNMFVVNFRVLFLFC